MPDETRMILEMLKDGKITVEQAERLLGAVGRSDSDAGQAPRSEGEGSPGASWSHSWCWDADGGKDWHSAWSWVGDLGGQIGEEVHRATAEARSAVADAMAEARRASDEARRAGREVRAQVIRIAREMGRESE